MKIKSEKGITLTTLVITIVLILMVGGMMGYYTARGIELQVINKLYSDINQIQNGVDEYYINNNELPILNISVDFKNSNNSNDKQNDYYVIDLSKLSDLNLNFGNDFENIKNENSLGNYKNVYIINVQSQTIYYLEGKIYENKTYYTKPIKYTKIEE